MEDKTGKLQGYTAGRGEKTIGRAVYTEWEPGEKENKKTSCCRDLQQEAETVKKAQDAFLTGCRLMQRIICPLCGQMTRLQPEKCFFPRACRGKKRISLSSCPRAGTL